MFKNNPKQSFALAPFVLSVVGAQKQTERSRLKCIFYLQSLGTAIIDNTDTFHHLQNNVRIL